MKRAFPREQRMRRQRHAQPRADPGGAATVAVDGDDERLPRRRRGRHLAGGPGQPGLLRPRRRPVAVPLRPGTARRTRGRRQPDPADPRHRDVRGLLRRLRLGLGDDAADQGPPGRWTRPRSAWPWPFPSCSAAWDASPRVSWRPLWAPAGHHRRSGLLHPSRGPHRLGGSYALLLVCCFFLGIGLASFSAAAGLASGWYPANRQGRALGVYGMGNFGQSLALPRGTRSWPPPWATSGGSGSSPCWPSAG